MELAAVVTRDSVLPLCCVKTLFVQALLPLAGNTSWLSIPKVRTRFSYRLQTHTHTHTHTDLTYLLTHRACLPVSPSWQWVQFQHSDERQSWRWMSVDFPGSVTASSVLTCRVCMNKNQNLWQSASWVDYWIVFPLPPSGQKISNWRLKSNFISVRFMTLCNRCNWCKGSVLCRLQEHSRKAQSTGTYCHC